MIEDLKSYPEYKDSGLPWLGKVPAQWFERRAKYFFREVDERSETGDEKLMSVSHKTGVTPRKQSVTMFLAESTVGYKICRPGDIAINTMWAFMGALGIARQEGIVSPAYGVYRPLRPGVIGSEYLDRLLRTDIYKTEYIRRSTGINSSRLRLYPDQFLQIPLLCPPPEEQAAIARFLAWATSRLDRAIGAKRRIIALLQEQKQAIIHRAVTRGLDPSVPLKDSGIPWLGEIPEHWEVRRTKAIADIKTGGKDTANRAHEGLYPFFVRSQKVERIDSYSFDGEAVLTAGDGAGVAKVFHYIKGKFDYHQRVYKFSDFRLVSGRFFYFYIKATLRFEALDASAKSTVDSLRLPLLQCFPCVIPPAHEQGRIIEFVDRETIGLDQAISRLESEVALLREYRTRLIADVVTGKLDVREVAAGLLEEVASDDAQDATEEDLDLEDEVPEILA